MVLARAAPGGAEGAERVRLVDDEPRAVLFLQGHERGQGRHVAHVARDAFHNDEAAAGWALGGAVFGREGGERALGVGRVAVAKDSHACAREGRAIRDRKRGRVVEHDRVPGAGKGGEDGRERGEVVAKEKEKGVGFR